MHLAASLKSTTNDPRGGYISVLCPKGQWFEPRSHLEMHVAASLERTTILVVEWSSRGHLCAEVPEGVNGSNLSAIASRCTCVQLLDKDNDPRGLVG